MTIIERMDSIIDERGVRAIELARRLNINPSVISTWRSRNKNPPAEYIFCICEFLDVSVEWLLTGEGDKYRQPIEVPTDVWKLQDYQRQAIIDQFGNLTEEQALLLDNYEKLWPGNKKEIRAVIQLKLEIQGDVEPAEGRREQGPA